ncbi:MAG: STAS domain-containing protein [Acidimicrobiaceae bacterium]|nr:STAS domain-containing protein [Acidimicrobiaceae bacterium]
MAVLILKQGSYLIATIESAMTDSDARRLQSDLMSRIGSDRATGVILDVSAMDVMDSFAGRVLRTIARAAGLRGAVTVMVGIQPEVAFTMVQQGMTLAEVNTALDLEEGLTVLDQLVGRRLVDGR